MERVIVYTDGASRGNPGHAAIGAAIFDGTQLVAEVREYLGEKTNNWAEYEAVIAALKKVKQLGLHTRPVECRMDSKLVAEQLSGNWQIKHENLFGQFIAVHNMLVKDFAHVVFVHVPREDNAHADRLANEALDART